MSSDRADEPLPGEVKDLSSRDQLVARMPREALKAFLYMFSGKPDSNIKVFYDPIVVRPDDLQELDSKIQDKLATHNIDAAVATIDISYADQQMIQFGGWPEFATCDWRTPKVTESVTLKWDFLVKLPAYKLPQRHTLLVKIASPVSPFHVLQAVFSRDLEEVEQLEKTTAIVVCRVDFIHHLLSEELIRIVDEWNKGRLAPEFRSPAIDFLKRHSESLRRAVHYSMPVLSAAAAAGILNGLVSSLGDPGATLTIGATTAFMYWLLASVVAVAVMAQVGRFLGSRAEAAIDRYGLTTVFDMTQGDAKRRAKMLSRNRRWLVKAALNLLGALVIEVAAAVIAARLFS